MTTLFLDLETYSDVPISHGTHRYAEKAEIMLLAYAIDDDPVIVLDLFGFSRSEVACFLHDQLDFDTVVVHNSHFDRTVLAANGIDLNPARIHDTMVMAMQHGLPGGLQKLCEILRVPLDKAKDAAGKKLIHLFCKPRPKSSKIRRATRETHPEQWAQFVDYARRDIEAMREIYKKLPKWNHENAQERELWLLDQAINDRGVAIDMPFVETAIKAIAERQGELSGETQHQTFGLVGSATQRDAMLHFIKGVFGVDMGDLQGSTVERFLADDTLDPALRELLTTRLQASMASVAKYQALARSTSSDGRLRGTLQFCGASRTGRWAGRLFQPQNLPRPSMKADWIEDGIAAMTGGTFEDFIYGDVMSFTSNALRGCIVAPEGKKLVVADLSNIEGRVLAWLAGEQWKLDAFAAFDRGEGEDLYKITAGRILGKKPGEITKDERQSVGKVSELALGYQGGVGAFLTFATAYGLDLDDLAGKARAALPATVLAEAGEMWAWMKKNKRSTFGFDRDTWVAIDGIKRAWRLAHLNICAFWSDLETAVIDVVDRGHAVKLVSNSILVDKKGSWLRIRLPSGRFLCYPAATVDDKGKITYMGVNQYSRRFERISTYGGKLAENVTQAAARDVLAHGMLAAEAMGYEVVLSVHDEIISERESAASNHTLASVMATNPDWAPGLPLAAAGFTATRYRKE